MAQCILYFYFMEFYELIGALPFSCLSLLREYPKHTWESCFFWGSFCTQILIYDMLVSASYPFTTLRPNGSKSDLAALEMLICCMNSFCQIRSSCSYYLTGVSPTPTPLFV